MLWKSLFLLLVALMPRGNDELENGGFELGSAKAYRGWTPIWPPAYTPTPEFRFVEGQARSGRRCAEVHTDYAGGYTSFTQELTIPRQARAVRLSGWIRPVEQGDGPFSTNLLLSLVHRDGTQFENHHTRRLTRVGDWEEVAVEAVIPEGMQRVTIRCGVSGPARVHFDDLALEWSNAKEELAAVRLAFTESHYEVTGAGPTSWAQFGIGIPFDGQTPLALELASDPPGRVGTAEVLTERDNRLLRVHLVPAAEGETVRLLARTWVLLEERVVGEDGSGQLERGERVSLAKARDLPEEAREHLQPAPGIPSDAEQLRDIARRLATKDLAALVSDVLAFLDEHLEAGAGVQGALESLERGSAACTGHANLGAALFQAAEVPARVLACTLIGLEQQEHYIVEVFTPKLGWRRVETTTKEFPLSPAKHVVLRVIHPDTPRNPVFAPVYYEASEGASIGPAYGALESRTSFQLAEHRESLLLDRPTLASLRDEAREDFETLKADAWESAHWFIDPTAERTARGQRLLSALAGHLD